MICALSYPTVRTNNKISFGLNIEAELAKMKTEGLKKIVRYCTKKDQYNANGILDQIEEIKEIWYVQGNKIIQKDSRLAAQIIKDFFEEEKRLNIPHLKSIRWQIIRDCENLLKEFNK